MLLMYSPLCFTACCSVFLAPLFFVSSFVFGDTVETRHQISTPEDEIEILMAWWARQRSPDKFHGWFGRVVDSVEPRVPTVPEGKQ